MGNIICPHCDNVQPCSRHTRRYRSSKGWKQLRAAVLLQHPTCKALAGCSLPSTEVDHIVSKRRGGTDTADNLIALCKGHHQAKTAQVDSGFGRLG